MNLKFSVTLFLILLSIKSYSQQNKPQIPFIVSEEVINKGTNYHDEEKYTYAIEEYEKVPLNDTNYGWAMYEKDYPMPPIASGPRQKKLCANA